MFTPAIVELFEGLLLFIGHDLLQVIIVSADVLQQLLHLVSIRSSALERYNVSSQKSHYNTFHGLQLLSAYNNTTEGRESSDLFRNKFNFFLKVFSLFSAM